LINVVLHDIITAVGIAQVYNQSGGDKPMGKADCEKNKEFSEAYDVTNKAANALRKAITLAKSPEGKKILLRAVNGCGQGAVQLFKMRENHQKRCLECKKGD
jgi:hypothetical protein